MWLEIARAPRLIVIALVVTAALAALAPRRGPRTQWAGGMIERDSIARVSPTTYRFVVRGVFAERGIPEDRPLAVTYRGELPFTVCSDADVALYGRYVGNHFDATEVIGFNNQRYSGCWWSRCWPAAVHEVTCGRPGQFAP